MEGGLGVSDFSEPECSLLSTLAKRCPSLLASMMRLNEINSCMHECYEKSHTSNKCNLALNTVCGMLEIRKYDQGLPVRKRWLAALYLLGDMSSSSPSSSNRFTSYFLRMLLSNTFCLIIDSKSSSFSYCYFPSRYCSLSLCPLTEVVCAAFGLSLPTPRGNIELMLFFYRYLSCFTFLMGLMYCDWWLFRMLALPVASLDSVFFGLTDTYYNSGKSLSYYSVG